MPTRFRYHVRRNAIAYVALFVALGGSAWAAGQIGPRDIKPDAVRSKHIKDGQVRSVDVADEGLTGADIASNSILGSEVAPDSLSGAKILEATLGKVPSAATADAVGGVTMRPVEYFSPASPVQRTILNLGGVVLTASCSDGPELTVQVTETAPGPGRIWSASTDAFDTDETARNEIAVNFAGPTRFNLVFDRDIWQLGQTVVWLPETGSVVTLAWAANSPTPQCEFFGTATQH